TFVDSAARGDGQRLQLAGQPLDVADQIVSFGPGGLGRKALLIDGVNPASNTVSALLIQNGRRADRVRAENGRQRRVALLLAQFSELALQLAGKLDDAHKPPRRVVDPDAQLLHE